MAKTVEFLVKVTDRPKLEVCVKVHLIFDTGQSRYLVASVVCSGRVRATELDD